MFNFSPEMMNQLAMNYDPQPILGAMSSAPAQAGFSGMDPAVGGGADGFGAPYSAAILPGEHDWMKKLGPALDPKSLAALQAMMPQQQRPQFIGGASAGRAPALNIQAPNFSAAGGQGPTAPVGAPPTLAALLAGRQ